MKTEILTPTAPNPALQSRKNLDTKKPRLHRNGRIFIELKKRYSTSPKGTNLSENQDVIIIDDDDEAEPQITRPPAKKTLISPQSSRDAVSNVFRKSTSETRGHPDATVPLNARQKWRLCTMWRTNKSLSDIASTLNTPETILQTYIYDLIKQDAMKSSSGTGGSPAAKE